jgi:hypothetical protein
MNTTGITNGGNNRSVTLPATSDTQFFRLRRPRMVHQITNPFSAWLYENQTHPVSSPGGLRRGARNLICNAL